MTQLRLSTSSVNGTRFAAGGQYTLKGYGAVVTNMKQNHKSIKELITAIEGDAELAS